MKLRFATWAMALLLGAPAAFSATTVIDANFETAALPNGGDLNKLTATVDTSRAHSGRGSCRIASEPKAAWGYLSFELDGKLDFAANHEFSVWVYTEKADTKISVYLSADDGSGERYTSVFGAGVIEPGKWCELRGTLFAGDLRGKHTDYRFTVRANGACWIDDLAFVSGLPETPAQIWPKLEAALHAAADKRASSLAPGASLVLDARNAALAPDTARVETALPAEAAAVIHADGMLVFAIDANEDLDLTGTLQLEPDADLHAGLRATVLAGDTVIAAPSVKAAPWEAVLVPRGSRKIYGAPPGLLGERPATAVSLTPFRLNKGRHYITISGPHIRTGGTFARLELRAEKRLAEKPLHTFALFSDTHLSFNRRESRNTMSGASSGAQLEAVLGQLKRDGAAFGIIAGDLTDDGRRAQFAELAGIVERAGLPIYGCINDDTARDSRADIAATIPNLFPDGPKNTDYAFTRPPVRYIVLDGSHWRDAAGKLHDHKATTSGHYTLRDGALEWLRATLAADTVTPTVVVSHYPFAFACGVSDVSGYDRGKPFLDKKLMEIIAAAPNVVATFNGHMHHNETAVRNGITSLQNTAFAEWPNGYRVFRVYADRMEWEIRQFPNRGLMREGVIPETALLWRLSTDHDDLAGTIKLAPR